MVTVTPPVSESEYAPCVPTSMINVLISGVHQIPVSVLSSVIKTQVQASSLKSWTERRVNEIHQDWLLETDLPHYGLYRTRRDIPEIEDSARQIAHPARNRKETRDKRIEMLLCDSPLSPGLRSGGLKKIHWNALKNG